MQLINFAETKIPPIGIGTWHMGSNPSLYAQQKATLQYGISHGATVIDTAEQYGNGDSESLVGDAIQNFPRQELFLISKFLPSHATRHSMKAALHRSLHRLGTSYLDLYLYHWPGITPLAEVVDNLETLRQNGLIRHWGVSNFDLPEMKHLLQVPGGQNVAANEDLYNLGSRGLDYDLLPWQRQHRIPLIAYAPIDQGDTRQHGITENQALSQVATEHHATAFQIMLAWSIRDGHTLAIPQTDQQSHMRDNIAAAKVHLTPADLKQLDQSFPKPTSEQPLDII